MTTISNDGYLYVQYQSGGNAFTNASPYTVNPWTSVNSTTAVLPTTTGSITTSGTWTYYCVDYVADNWSISTYYLPITTTTTNVPSTATSLNNSYLYVYNLGTGGTGSSGDGGGGTGGLAGCCFNPTWNISADFNNINSSMGGIDYTQTNYFSYTPTDPPPPAINLYAGNGSSTTSTDGGNGSIVLPTTNIDDITSETLGSYILPPSSTTGTDPIYSVQTFSPNIAFCIGGIGGEAASGGSEGTSSNTLPTGYPNWVASQTTSGGVYQIMLADGSYYSMPSSPAGTSAAPQSILFAIFSAS